MMFNRYRLLRTLSLYSKVDVDQDWLDEVEQGS